MFCTRVVFYFSPIFPSHSLTPLSPHLCSAHPLLTSSSFPYISPPPHSDRIQGPTSPPPSPPVPKPLHSTILIPLSVRQSDVIPILQTSSHIFYPLSRTYSKPLALGPSFLQVSFDSPPFSAISMVPCYHHTVPTRGRTGVNSPTSSKTNISA